MSTRQAIVFKHLLALLKGGHEWQKAFRLGLCISQAVCFGFWVFCLFVCFLFPYWGLRSQVEAAGRPGRRNRWRAWDLAELDAGRFFFPTSRFLCSLFVPGSACCSLQSSFFPLLWEFMVSWETCVDLCLKKTSERHWFFCFYGAFSTHETSISATLMAACLFPDAVPDFMFSFQS